MIQPRAHSLVSPSEVGASRTYLGDERAGCVGPTTVELVWEWRYGCRRCSEMALHLSQMFGNGSTTDATVEHKFDN